MRRNKPISDTEKARRARQRAQSLAAVEQLLYTRRQTAKALGNISVATVRRLEAAHKLDVVRLAGSPNGVAFHRAAQVRALAKGGEEQAASGKAATAITAGPNAEVAS